jgi:hypothetical protein
MTRPPGQGATVIGRRARSSVGSRGASRAIPAQTVQPGSHALYGKTHAICLHTGFRNPIPMCLNPIQPRSFPIQDRGSPTQNRRSPLRNRGSPLPGCRFAIRTGRDPIQTRRYPLPRPDIPDSSLRLTDSDSARAAWSWRSHSLAGLRREAAVGARRVRGSEKPYSVLSCSFLCLVLALTALVACQRARFADGEMPSSES